MSYDNLWLSEYYGSRVCVSVTSKLAKPFVYRVETIIYQRKMNHNYLILKIFHS